MNDKKFHQQFIDQVNKLSNQNTEYNLIDIGANTGLLSRCLLNNVNNIKTVDVGGDDDYNPGF